MPSTDPQEKTSRATKLLSWTSELFSSNAKTIISGAILVPLLTAGYLLLKGYAVDKIDGHINNVISKRLQGEVGSLVAGKFILSPVNRSNNVYIYCPLGHEAKLYYKLNEFTSGRYVEMQGHCKSLKRLENQIGVIDIKCTQCEDPQGVELFERQHIEMDDLLGVTFQLSGPDVDERLNEIKSGTISAIQQPIIEIEVSYTVLVAPTITYPGKSIK